MRHDVDSLTSAGLKIVAGGTACGVAVSLVAVIATALAAGGGPGIVLALGAGAGLVAMSIGQAVLAAAANLTGKAVLAAGLSAYALGVAVAVAALVVFRQTAQSSLTWAGIGVTVGAYGYLAGAILAYRRLRLPLFDAERKDEHRRPRTP